MAREGILLLEVVEAVVRRTRPDGTVFEERPSVVDLVVNGGRSWLAQRIGGGDSVASPMAYMAVGTATTAPGLTDTTLTGEIKRKALAVNSATSGNLYTAVATFGGYADGITSTAITEAGVFNHAGSGQGTMFQRVTFSAVTLANSDILHLTLETRVGSNTVT